MPVRRRVFVQLRFRSVLIISGNFESRFQQCDESEVNADRQKCRCNKSLITDRPEKRALPESGQQALTVALESAVTMRRGGPTLPGAVRRAGGLRTSQAVATMSGMPGEFLLG